MSELAPRGAFSDSLQHARLNVSPLPPAPRTLLVGPAEAFSLPLPQLPNTVARLPGLGRCLWMNPEQWLLLGPAPASLPAGIWALDVGSRYAGLSVRGERAAEVLASGCGLDLRLRAFPVNRCARTRIEQVPAILLREAQDYFEVLVERPLAHHFWLWLQKAASNS